MGLKAEAIFSAIYSFAVANDFCRIEEHPTNIITAVTSHLVFAPANAPLVCRK